MARRTVRRMIARMLLAGLALVSLDASAGDDIYKCVAGTATSYQSAPCAIGQAEIALKVARVAIEGQRNANASVRVTEPRKRALWTRTAIEVGMSDDEVLNLPGWGRPAQVTRARLARGWEEVWRYGDSYSGGRELRFVNARLADIVATPAAMAWSTR